MEYYVYENWIHKYAKVHQADCKYCNNGNGIHKDSSDKYGRWHGPFKQIKTGFINFKTQQIKISNCFFCLREKKKADD